YANEKWQASKPAQHAREHFKTALSQTRQGRTPASPTRLAAAGCILQRQSTPCSLKLPHQIVIRGKTLLRISCDHSLQNLRSRRRNARRAHLQIEWPLF